MTQLILAAVLAASNTPGLTPPAAAGTATVPLSELLPLLTKTEAAAKEPADLLVSRLSLRARPGERGLWIDGEVTVRLLSGASARVPVLKVGAETLFEELPASDSAALTVVNGQLTAVARTSSPQALSFKLLQLATGSGAERAVSLQMAPGMPPAPLRVEVDDALFAVKGATVVREWGGYVVFPVNGRYTFAWTEREPVEEAATVQRRAPVELVVTEATSRWVSTLEGRATHEVRLALQVDRAGELVVDVPKGQVLLAARVNGQPVEVPPEARQLALKVAPTTLGGVEAVVELSLLKDLGVFHLSGRFELEAPRLSWPVKRWQSAAVLPAVFNYQREGGSMEQVGAEGAAGQGDVPGKALAFSQHLVQASAPSVALRYSVDISTSYFR